MSHDLNKGDRVKYSQAALRSLRDGWLNAGSYEKKSQAKRWLDEKAAQRGTIVDVCSNQYTSRFYRISWDHGPETDSATYLVDKVD